MKSVLFKIQIYAILICLVQHPIRSMDLIEAAGKAFKNAEDLTRSLGSLQPQASLPILFTGAAATVGAVGMIMHRTTKSQAGQATAPQASLSRCPEEYDLQHPSDPTPLQQHSQSMPELLQLTRPRIVVTPPSEYSDQSEDSDKDESSDWDGIPTLPSHLSSDEEIDQDKEQCAEVYDMVRIERTAFAKWQQTVSSQKLEKKCSKLIYLAQFKRKLDYAQSKGKKRPTCPPFILRQEYPFLTENGCKVLLGVCNTYASQTGARQTPLQEALRSMCQEDSTLDLLLRQFIRHNNERIFFREKRTHEHAKRYLIKILGHLINEYSSDTDSLDPSKIIREERSTSQKLEKAFALLPEKIKRELK